MGNDSYELAFQRLREYLDELASYATDQDLRHRDFLMRIQADTALRLEELRNLYAVLKDQSEEHLAKARRQMEAQSKEVGRLREDLSAVGREMADLRGTASEKESWFRHIFEVTSVGMSLTTLDGEMLNANDALLQTLGYSREDMLTGRIRWGGVTPTEYKQFDEWVIQQIMESGSCLPYEKEYIRKDGSRVPVLFGGSRLTTADGDVVLSFVFSLLERERSRQRLELAELSLDQGADGILWIAEDGRILQANKSAIALLGYFEEEVLAMGVAGTGLVANPAAWSAYWEEAKRGDHLRFETRYRTKQGSTSPVEVTAWYLRFDNQEYVQAAIRDITKLKAAQERLHESEQRYRDFIDDSAEGICCFAFSPPIPTDLPEAEQIDRICQSSYLIECNSAMAKIWGFIGGADARGKQAQEPLMNAGPASVDNLRAFIQSGYRLTDHETRETDSQGQTRCFRTSLVGTIRNGHVLYIWQRRIDVTEQDRAQSRLQEHATLLNQARDAIIVRGFDCRVVFWNKGAERIYGWTAEEALGQDLRDLFFANDGRHLFDRACIQLEADGEWVGEWELKNKSAKRIIIESRWTMVRGHDGVPRSILAIDTDVTEKKELEARFLRAQRVESLGTLAAGIAHDMTNVLSPILLAIEALRWKTTDQDSQYFLAMLKLNTERGAALINQVLSFAKGAEGSRTTLQLKYTIQESVGILIQTLPKNIEIRLSLQDDLWVVEGDATQVNQVFMNLCVNARDAMPDGGTITIKGENAKVAANSERHSGRSVIITISDTGPGIAPNMIDRIFEPFFTTKGAGTGLGLSTVRSIVESHGGWVEVSSELGRGTAFRIYLPAKDAFSAQPSADLAADARMDLMAGRGESLLLVDDEKTLLSILEEGLRQVGYHVMSADSAEEAIRLYRANHERIHAVVIDLMIPTRGDIALAEELRRINPKVKILGTGGLTANATWLGAPSEHQRTQTFLRKPFGLGELLRSLDSLRET